MKRSLKHYNTIINEYTEGYTDSKEVVYHSMQDKTQQLADSYAKTDQFSHRYLAYRDIPNIIKKYVRGSCALDYGTGTGISANFLHQLGLNTIGIDINPIMLEKARKSFHFIKFLEVDRLKQNSRFDLVFSSFVLFDMRSKEEITEYFNKASTLMHDSGILIAITASEELYSVYREWTAYDSDFNENKNLHSGDIARLRLRDPVIEFHDYFWKENDYVECVQNSKLNILEIHRPLGCKNDPYLWKDEKYCPPFTIYILEKQKQYC